MIGRHKEDRGVLAHVGPRKIAQVAVAGSLIAGAVAVDHLTELPEAVVAGLCIASLSLTGLPIVLGALRGVLRLETNVDELVALAIVASVVLGEWTAAATVSFIMILGALIEEATSERARRYIERLGASSPDHALLVEGDGPPRQVPASELGQGQLILVRPGDVIAADGVVEAGESDVDESMLTGESLPVGKGAGDTVSAGTINAHGSLRVRVLRVGEESAHGRILRIVEEAEQHRAPIMRVAERYARWFTPSILLLSGAVWLLSGDVYRAVTMLIVGCPCAFVLATPTAVMAALGAASRAGVLIKGGKYLEAAARVDTVAFDKTGTLTSGRFSVVAVSSLDDTSEGELLAAAGRLEAGAEHPIARAVVARAEAEGLPLSGSVDIQRSAGLGVAEVGADPEQTWRIGSLRFMQSAGVDVAPAASEVADEHARGGLTPIFLARGQALRGVLSLEDELRPEADHAIAALAADGIGRIFMLTGDVDPVARRVASRVGIPVESVHAGLLPEEKYEHLAALEKQGTRVCYVGDGTNDGPALAVASVGVSIGSRENTVALETADAVLMRDGLAGLPFLLRLGRATARTINQNLILFGLILNASLLVLSATGVLTPILGALAHNVGSISVVLNSSRLLRFGRAEGGGEGPPPRIELGRAAPVDGPERLVDPAEMEAS